MVHGNKRLATFVFVLISVLLAMHEAVAKPFYLKTQYDFMDSIQRNNHGFSPLLLLFGGRNIS